MKRMLIAWDFFGVINAVEPSPLHRTLQALLDLGAEHIIVSHSTQMEIEHFLELHQLRQFFVAIYGAEWHMADSGMGKAPALKDYVANQGPFAATTMVGDSMGDMADARLAGMRAVLFDPDRHYTNVANDVDAVATSLADVLSAIQDAL